MDLRRGDGRTALFDATTQGHPELVKLLVRPLRPSSKNRRSRHVVRCWAFTARVPCVAPSCSCTALLARVSSDVVGWRVLRCPPPHVLYEMSLTASRCPSVGLFGQRQHESSRWGDASGCRCPGRGWLPTVCHLAHGGQSRCQRALRGLLTLHLSLSSLPVVLCASAVSPPF